MIWSVVLRRTGKGKCWILRNMVEIILILAFCESGCDSVRGITKIQPLFETRNGPLYLFAYSDSDFISPHYESVWPKDPTFLPSSILPPSLRPSSLGIEVADVINLEDTEMSGNLQVTEENIEDIQIVVQERER